jgi:hypothetical protein
VGCLEAGRIGGDVSLVENRLREGGRDVSLHGECSGFRCDL